jgi:hypothetical protein
MLKGAPFDDQVDTTLLPGVTALLVAQLLERLQ